MNAAFLLVTSAWFAGADPAPATTNVPSGTTAGAVASVPAGGAIGAGAGYSGGSCCGGAGYGGSASGGGCGGGCGCEIECCCKPSCLQRLKAMCHRNKCCCECCNTCNTCATTSCCNTGCGSTGCGSSMSGCGSNYSGMSCGCGSCCETCCKPSLCQRIKARCHRNTCCESCCETGCNSGCNSGCGGSAYGAAGIGGAGIGGTAVPGVMPGAESIKVLPKEGAPGNKLPSGTNKGAVQSNSLDVTPTSSSNVIETETKNPFELDRRYEMRVGRAADYSWVTGQLFYVHADGGLWVLRYAPLSKEDRNGGSVVLAGDRQMDSYREGDLVKVHGEILNQKGSLFLGGPEYRIESIELIDRSAQ